MEGDFDEVAVVDGGDVVLGRDIEGVAVFVEAVLADEEDGGAAGSGLVDCVEMARLHSVVGLQQAAGGLVQDGPRDVRDLFFDQRAVGVDQPEASFFFGREESTI